MVSYTNKNRKNNIQNSKLVIFYSSTGAVNNNNFILTYVRNETTIMDLVYRRKLSLVLL